MDRNPEGLQGRFRGTRVRLVRACGSKQPAHALLAVSRDGQARKSLWIETHFFEDACGNVQGQARKSLWIETLYVGSFANSSRGQARKSLWIETFCSAG